jgi:hypothetical protein
VRRAPLGPVLLALVLRIVAVLATDRVVVDVERYQRVAAHLLDVSANPYETRRLYPYPPPWAVAEAAAEWLSRRGVGSFPVNIKLPVLAADLLLVAVLAAAAGAGRASPLAPWLYAVHPVSLLVGGVHGQFDAIPLLFLLLATEALRRGRRDASALALAAAIATKSFPVLALPFLALGTRESWRSAARYAALALGPGAALVLPFAIADFGALQRELLAYGGIADFGWTGVLRGVEWLATGALPRAEARFWPVAAFVSKALFLAAWAGLVVAVRSERLRLGVERAILATMLAFSTLYGLQSAQYLLWAVPFGLLRAGTPGQWRGRTGRSTEATNSSPQRASVGPGEDPRGDEHRMPGREAGGTTDSLGPVPPESLGMTGPMIAGAVLHAVAATAGLVGFYLFLAPRTLFPAPLGGGAAVLAGRLWLGGAAATLGASGLWLATALREGRDSGLRAATDASERPSISPSR